MSEFVPSTPEKEQVVLILPDADLEIRNFTEYSFNSNFLAPVDGFQFTIGDERLSDRMRDALKPGAKVRLTVNDADQCAGYIDSIEISASKGSGSVWQIHGRDKLGQVADACADPTLAFKEGQSLEDALVALFSPFGWSSPTQFVESNETSRNIKSNRFRSKTRKSDGKGFSKRKVKAYKLHQLRPYPKEGVLEFANRLATRFGLWIWSTPSGEQIVVSEPDFDTDPFYSLLRNRDGTTNVLDGSVKFDAAEQPTVIIADSYSQAGEFGKGRIKVIYANTAIRLADGVEEPDLSKYINAGAKVLGGHTFPASSSLIAPRPRIQFAHDDESQTFEHLEAFARREMALAQRKSLTVSYTVEGHGQNTKDGFIPWTVDTTVHVKDELAGLDEVLYVLGRTFNKSRSGGTTTHLELIRLHTLVFSDGSTRSR